MTDLNKVLFTGRVGKEPISIPASIPIARVTIGIESIRKNTKTEWIPVKAYGDIANEILKLKPGYKIEIIGHMEYETYKGIGEFLISADYMRILHKKIQSNEPDMNRVITSGGETISFQDAAKMAASKLSKEPPSESTADDKVIDNLPF